MAKGRSVPNSDGTFTPPSNSTAPRPDLNSENDILRRIYERLLGVLGIGGIGTAGVTTALRSEHGKLALASDDTIAALLVEQRITNLLLAQRFGITEDLRAALTNNSTNNL